MRRRDRQITSADMASLERKLTTYQGVLPDGFPMSRRMSSISFFRFSISTSFFFMSSRICLMSCSLASGGTFESDGRLPVAGAGGSPTAGS